MTDPLARDLITPVDGSSRYEDATRFRRRTVIMVSLSNHFCDGDGWYDIRVYRFAKFFQKLGLDTVVYCRTFAGAKSECEIYDGIRVVRLLFQPPVLSEKTENSSENGEKSATSCPTPGDRGQACQSPRDLSLELGRDNSSSRISDNDFAIALPEMPLCFTGEKDWTERNGFLRSVYRNLPSLGQRAFLSAYRMSYVPIRRLCAQSLSRFRRAVRKAFYLLGFRVYQRNFLLSRRLKQLSLAESPVLVYAADLPSLREGYAIAKRAKAPFIYDSHEYFLSRGEQAHMSWLGKVWDQFSCRHIEGKYLQRCDVVISVSEGIINAFRQRVPSGRFLCLRNIPDRPKQITRRNLIREQLGLGPDIKILLHIGNITTGRCFAQAIEALTLLPNNVILAFLGRGALRNPLEALAAQLGVSDRIFFLGHVPQDQVLAYAESADCGLCLVENVALSYYLSLPNKLFQYLAAGLPQVCSDFPDMKAIVEGRGIGVAVDPACHLSIAEGIRKIIHNPVFLEQMRANCIKAVQEDLNWESESQKLCSLDFLSALSSSAI